MGLWRQSLAVGVLLLCIGALAEGFKGEFLSHDDTYRAVMQIREAARLSREEQYEMGNKVTMPEKEKIIEYLHKLIDMFEALNATEQQIEGGKVLAIFLETAFQALRDNGNTFECNTCMLLVRVMKVVTVFYTVDETLNVVHNFCMNFMPKIDPGLNDLPDDTELLCNIVYIQGPYIYDVLGTLSITSRVQCQYMNLCLPPPSNNTQLHTRPVFTPKPPTTKAHHGDGGQSENETGRKLPVPNAKSRRRRSSNLANALKIAYLTDVHFDLEYQENTNVDCGLPVCCTEGQGPGPSGPWGNYNCDTPYRTYTLFLEKVKSLDVDLVLYGGDNPSHKLWTDTLWGHFNCSIALVNGLKEVLPGMPAYPNVGNHEAYPTDLYYTGLNATLELNNYSVQWWQTLANFSTENQQTMSEWWYYAKEIQPGLVLLSFNTLFMYTQNFYISIINSKILTKNSYMIQMQQFMVETMENAIANNQKVLLMGHVPPGNGATIPGRWLTNFVLTYGDHIVLYLAGHTHMDDFRLITDPNTGETKGVSQIAPSLGCWNQHNPGMRIYYLDPETYEALDYQQYLLDLATALNSTDPTIEMTYQATVEYDMPDVTPASFANLATRMNTNEVLFNTFVQNYYTLVNVNSETCMNASCHNSVMCRVTNSNYDQRETCTIQGTYMPAPPTTTTTNTPPVVCQSGATGSFRWGQVVALVALCFLGVGSRL